MRKFELGIMSGLLLGILLIILLLIFCSCVSTSPFPKFERTIAIMVIDNEFVVNVPYGEKNPFDCEANNRQFKLYVYKKTVQETGQAIGYLHIEWEYGVVMPYRDCIVKAIVFLKE